MLTLILVLGIVILALTLASTLRCRGRQMTAAWIPPLYGGLLLVVLALGAIGVRYSLDRDYRRCVDQKEVLNRQYKATLRFYDAIDILTHTQRYTHDPVTAGQPSLRDGLFVDLIESLPECHRP